MALDPLRFRAYDGLRAPKWPFELNKDSPQAQGLVGWWPMGPIGGNVLRDFSGRGFDLTLNNMEPDDWIQTRFGPALDFDGTDEFAEVNRAILETEPLTMCCWFRPKDITTNSALVTMAD